MKHVPNVWILKMLVEVVMMVVLLFLVKVDVVCVSNQTKQDMFRVNQIKEFLEIAVGGECCLVLYARGCIVK